MTLTEQMKASMKKLGILAHAQGKSKHAVGLPCNVWLDVFKPDPDLPNSRIIEIGFSVDSDEDEYLIIGFLDADGTFTVERSEQRGV